MYNKKEHRASKYAIIIGCASSMIEYIQPKGALLH